MSASPALAVRELSVAFRTRRGVLTAVDDVSFDIAAGEVLGVVGESGAVADVIHRPCRGAPALLHHRGGDAVACHGVEKKRIAIAPRASIAVLARLAAKPGGAAADIPL